VKPRSTGSQPTDLRPGRASTDEPARTASPTAFDRRLARGFYAWTVDAATVAGLVEIAKEARARARQQDAGASVVVEDRYPEMLEALDWCLTSEQPETAYRLASALVPFWVSTNRMDDGDAWFERALGTVAAGEASRARALYDHGYLVLWPGRYDVARQRFSDALALAERLGDCSLQALALAGLARVALYTDVDEALRLLRQADAVTRNLADSDPGRSSTLHVLGVALQMSGDLEAAREVMSARLSMGRSTDDEFVVWVESANLSMVERRLGNLDRAEELAVQALQINAERGDEMSVAWIINSLAAVAAAKGDHDRAATLIGTAAALLERAGGEWPPDEREQYHQTLSIVTAALSPRAIAKARARGAGYSVTDGIAYALRASD
jgi:tetratricopeptide (TPR) repeat protein